MPGDDLLSRLRSTIGAGVFHDRVRDGIGWGPSGRITGISGMAAHDWLDVRDGDVGRGGERRSQACWPISIARL